MKSGDRYLFAFTCLRVEFPGFCYTRSLRKLRAPVLALKLSAPSGGPAPHKMSLGFAAWPKSSSGFRRLNRHPEKRASFSHLFGSLAGWKRPVSNPTPLQAFREERVAARFEVALFCISKSLGILLSESRLYVAVLVIGFSIDGLHHQCRWRLPYCPPSTCSYTARSFFSSLSQEYFSWKASQPFWAYFRA
ncbi:hypothetical protein Desdi_3230 [Desulfitobacterium dichloroeliminans LMG P-21439]|uniref:Uncharacterized protein n=1 Tax=Desulfitobacterium dichloroeliminans (strain LMG P-21439 / DCA1) TaxID=871963 RepID=L0F9Y9_DESDL|nr:hypothetical protein Desdi_3230 [Desulfitobacterium dichloroeliminans LMG P-21439]